VPTTLGIHFNLADRSDADAAELGARPTRVRGVGRAGAGARRFENEEAAARFYLSQALGRDERPAVRGLTAPDRPEVVPDLRLRDSRSTALTGTTVVRFDQTAGAIPIFGTRAVVELDANLELLGMDAELQVVEGVSPLAALSPAQARDRIADFAEKPRDAIPADRAPELTYYHDDAAGRWHLAYYFRDVPAAPPGTAERLRSHGPGPAPGRRELRQDYLVDAHSGAVLRHWSSSPTLDVPVQCEGQDEDQRPQRFFGNEMKPDRVQLRDPLRRIQTFDFGMHDIENDPVPTAPIEATSTRFDHRAAVSAHVNATRVHDFYGSELKRSSIDDKGMEVLSYVNCTLPSERAFVEWPNAVWWKQRMWYGQTKDAGGELRSFSRFLDIIAHELAHGVTEFTADLVYQDESGALNESYSDVFGVIIANWDESKPRHGGDVAGWSWEIGKGLGKNGLPMRDLRDPRRTGDPDHMRDYLHTRDDDGGVHTNSNIHNKAAYHVLTARDAGGAAVFTPYEVALLYYLCLHRLSRTATFVQTLTTLLNVAGIYLTGDPKRAEKLDVLRAAYAAVGIEEKAKGQ
jgi:Zn-dependent metalloprotease